MKRNVVLVCIVGLLMVLSGSVFAEPQMNPGKWQITTQTQMAGMPPQTVTHTQCITAQDMVPVSQDANQECQVTDIVYSGNTVSWKISCGGQGGGMEGTGSVTYSGDAMNGVMDMTITGGANMKVKNTLTGRRLGECDGSEPTTTVNSQPVPTGTSQNPVADTLKDDAKDVGSAAHDEAKQTTVEEVRKGVRGVFKGLFK